MANTNVELYSIINSTKNLPKARIFITLVAIILSVSTYYIIVEYYYPTKNIISQFFNDKVSYTFYSGNKGGFYIYIGKKLEDFITNEDFVIKNVETEGGFENVMQVVNKPHSFGLVQESAVPEGEFINENIRYITPLYMERLHILYNHDKYKDSFENNGKDIETIILRETMADHIKIFFDSSAAHLGGIGSGTQVVSEYLLSHFDLNVKPLQDDDVPLSNYDKLIKGDIDILFTMAGAPLPEVQRILDEEDKDFRLMSIGIAAKSQINKDFGTELRLTNFKDKYENSKADNVTTLGSYAFLISSPDVPADISLKLLKTLAENRNSIIEEMDINKAAFQLNEIDFIGDYSDLNSQMLISFLQNFILFIVSVTLSTAAIIVFLVWVLSNAKLARYTRNITGIFKEKFPKIRGLKEEYTTVPVPKVPKSQIKNLTEIIQGLNLLYSVRSEVRDDYDTGGIMDSHYRFLMGNIDDSIREFQNIFARVLCASINNQDPLPTDLYDFYTAGFLDKEGYEDVTSCLQPQQVINEKRTNGVKS